MDWQERFQSHPQFGQAVQFATGRPSWVLKATGLVAGLVFLVPLIALAVLLVCAAIVTLGAWIVFNTIAGVLSVFTGGSKIQQGSPTTPGEDGRENVRVIQRP